MSLLQTYSQPYSLSAPWISQQWSESHLDIPLLLVYGFKPISLSEVPLQQIQVNLAGTLEQDCCKVIATHHKEERLDTLQYSSELVSAEQASAETLMPIAKKIS